MVTYSWTGLVQSRSKSLKNLDFIPQNLIIFGSFTEVVDGKRPAVVGPGDDMPPAFL